MKDNSALNKPVGIWIRVSTEDQAKGESPEHHEERARSYAKSRGWQVKEVYDLAGQTGKAVMQHPEAKRMMKDVERGHITGLVFSKLARLSRNRRELEDFSDFFNKHNADLISLSEAIDTSTAGGRMFFHLLGVFAQWEREEITERVNASVLTRAKLGKSINGTSPYGYEWKDRKLIVRPEEAAIRRKAYELFLRVPAQRPGCQGAKCRRLSHPERRHLAGHLNSAHSWRNPAPRECMCSTPCARPGHGAPNPSPKANGARSNASPSFRRPVESGEPDHRGTVEIVEKARQTAGAFVQRLGALFVRPQDVCRRQQPEILLPQMPQ